MMLEPARPGDREAVNALALQVHRLHVRWRPDIYTDTASLYPLERFSEEREAGHLYVVRQEGGVIAYVLIRTSETLYPGLVKRKILSLDELCVDESCRHHGLGRAILEEVRLLGIRLGCTDMQLSCDPHNNPAIALYEGFGMEVKSVHYQRKL